MYCLVDPRDGTIFYIGRGKNNRIYAHEHSYLDGIPVDEEDEVKGKIKRISEIYKGNRQVERYIIRHGLTEDVAKEVEATLIDFINEFGHSCHLANQIAGFGSDRGLASDEDIKEALGAEEAVIGHSAILININQKYKSSMSEDDLYKTVKCCWIIGEKRRKKADYVFAVYRGIIREVYRITDWYERNSPDDKGNRRVGFDGTFASEEIRERYKKKSVRNYWKKGAQNPIKYAIHDQSKQFYSDKFVWQPGDITIMDRDEADKLFKPDPKKDWIDPEDAEVLRSGKS